MGQQLHQFDILTMFFDDFACNIEWEGDEYDNTSLVDVLNLMEGSNTGSTNESDMAAGQEAEGSI